MLILKKYSSWIVLFGLLLAMGSLFWFGILPLKQSLRDAMRGIEEQYAEEENQRKQVGRLPELADQYTTILRSEPVLDILMREDELVGFIKTLEGLASEMQVQMIITSKEGGKIIEAKKVPAKSSTAEESSDTPSAKAKVINIADDVSYDRYLHLNVRAEGQYTNIVAFLRKIETLPVGLDVIGVDMQKIDDATLKERAAPDRPAGNPFAIITDGNILSQPTTPLAEKNLLEATFDILVYVDKKE